MKTGKQIQNLPERRGLVRAVLSGPVARSSFRLATGVAVAGGIVGVLGVAPAVADPVSRTLRYTCSNRLIENLPVAVRLQADIPKSTAVGRPTPKFVVNAAVPVNADATKILGKVGVKTVEGTVDARVSVGAPEGDVDVTFPTNVRADVPASGPFYAKATGSAPALTFRQPGSAKIIVGDLVARLTPRDVSGEVTFPGKIDARCKLDAGQNNVLASFHITGTRTTTGPFAPGTSGTSDTTPSSPSAADETASGPSGTDPKGALSQTGADVSPWLLGGGGCFARCLRHGLHVTGRAVRLTGPDRAGSPARSCVRAPESPVTHCRCMERLVSCSATPPSPPGDVAPSGPGSPQPPVAPPARRAWAPCASSTAWNCRRASWTRPVAK
ncbi:hypothetical protein SAMN06272771_6418 [Streptomyces sp. Ag82_O1-12]|uniref:DUF6801 domain-containing protein n=1 Tax=Streptomyces sp. Ag82_G6-1 TaxID=1938853 RepID=UPI000BC93456|nr:hypothetical protein SAMN06272771_6418 [Streptomyces sp. Ag82_O1-12]SOD48961.1 hypothetical protein SAMN06272727_6422 [Streptomyces sp. Ag82_G6-1]